MNLFSHFYLFSFLITFFTQFLYYSFQNTERSLDNLNSDEIEQERKSNESTENMTRFNRQLDTDIESKFNTNPNTIIRTGESRILGAKYLNETVVPTNRDCLTWCLKTANCNAVVYEEKDVHSCYMFDCGPPVASLCRFTPHNFFFSSTLKISQHSYELSQWGNQVKHEKELANLKTASFSTSTLHPTTEYLTRTPDSQKINGGPLKQNDICHHYQFQCANSTECIAIYNVCDGIPQCPDGSDESIDLKCHMKDAGKEVSKNVEKLTETVQLVDQKIPNISVAAKLPHPTLLYPSPSHVSLPVSEKSKSHENNAGLRHLDNSKSIWPDRSSTTHNSKLDYYHQSDGTVNESDDGLGSPFVHKHSQFVAANDPHVQSLNQWSNDYDQYSQRGTSLDQQFNPYDGSYPQTSDQYISSPLSPEYEGTKGYHNYRPEDLPYWPNQDVAPDSPFPLDEYPQPNMHAMSKQNMYDKESLYAQQMARSEYPDVKHRPMHKPPENQPLSRNHASVSEELKLRRFPLHQQPYLVYGGNLPSKTAPNYPELSVPHYDHPQNGENPLYNSDELIRASLENQRPLESGHRKNPYLNGLRRNPENPQKNEKPVIMLPSTTIPSSTTHPPLKGIKNTVMDLKMSVTELYEASRTRTQEANIAILALVMGLTITILLFIFMCCRFKTIRRRMSRKGKTLAHDADYLVNGMYL